MHHWQLQEAKAKFSKVVQEALAKGPQRITVHGKPSVILISQTEYDKLVHPKESFVQFMKKSPLKGLNLRRDKSKNRDVEL